MGSMLAACVVQSGQVPRGSGMQKEPTMTTAKTRVAVLVPCYNEAATIQMVVRDFKQALDQPAVYVYDNNSTDDTPKLARAAGAIVRRVTLQGKGNVIRRMFADIDADYYVLVDGDATYDAQSAPRMLAAAVADQLDMVVGVREGEELATYRAGHRFGNSLFTNLVGSLFRQPVADMLSGYRVLSRRFVKSFPALAHGFETETELTVHALELRMPTAAVRTPYKSRPAGSASKLRTYRDGWRILWLILQLLKRERPLGFFGVLCGVFALTSLGLAYPLFVTFVHTGLVPRFPTAILSTGLMMLAFLSLACGIILDAITHARREFRRLAYLSIPSARVGERLDPAAHNGPF